MLFLRIFQHLLMRAKSVSITINKKLRQFFDGLTVVGVDAKSFVDLVWLDIFPDTTRELARWEKQFNLLNANSLTEQERRDRLDAAWKAVGGQSPRYLQDTLQANGFDVYVHDWWELPAADPPVARNPNTFISGGTPQLETMMGGPNNQMGEAHMLMGQPDDLGFLLVNKITETSKDFVTGMGAPNNQMGESHMLMGQFTKYLLTLKEYSIPTDSSLWPYFVYVGGETFPDFANVPIERRDEFETLILSLFPGQLWIGMLITYS